MFQTDTTVSLGFQAHPLQSLHEIITDSSIVVHHGMNHTEGGWSKDIDPSDGDRVAIEKKTIESQESYLAQLRTSSASVSKALFQNTTLNIYDHVFADCAGDYGTESANMQLLTVIRDTEAKSLRWVSDTSWHPEDPSVIAVAYSSNPTQTGYVDVPVQSFVWDVQNFSHPLVCSCPFSFFAVYHILFVPACSHASSLLHRFAASNLTQKTRTFSLAAVTTG
jgi:dynein intermediate chain 2